MLALDAAAELFALRECQSVQMVLWRGPSLPRLFACSAAFQGVPLLLVRLVRVCLGDGVVCRVGNRLPTVLGVYCELPAWV